MLADLILVDLKSVGMVPNNDLYANLVYSAAGNCVSDSIINGKLVMKDRHVAGEDRIIEQAAKVFK